MMIRGVDFVDKVAPLVEELVQKLIAVCGESHCYIAHGEIKFALRPPSETKHNIAYRMFLRIKPIRAGAIVKRPRPPKDGKTSIPITKATLAQNYDFVQGMDDELVAFFPGIQEPMIISHRHMSSILTEISQHGYVVIENPRWAAGMTVYKQKDERLMALSRSVAIDTLPNEAVPAIGPGSDSALQDNASEARKTALASANMRSEGKAQTYRGI